jgi:hypothetical protein
MHPTTAGLTQCDRILEALQAAPGEWVSLITLWQASGSMAVHSRINDLRKRRGLIIEQRNQYKGKQCHSSYRLITTNPQA